MKNFTGNDVRNLRKELNLSRAQLGEHIGVSPETIAKWEQAKEKEIRKKYENQLNQLKGFGAVGLAAGLVAAPALIPAALLAGGSGMLGSIFSDEDLERASQFIDGLKKLSPEERETYFNLSKKMNNARE